jgi:uncharacterized membrane protein YhhN
VPYLAVSVIHVVALVVGMTAVSTPTKWLLMPALLFALVATAPRSRLVIVVGGVAVILSWCGDVLISTPGGTGFVLGLASFLLAHVTYLVLFLAVLRTRRVPVWALVYVVWLVGLLIVITPHLGTLVVPVVAYGVILAASTAAALGTSRPVALGALLFLLSDSVLVFKLFWPGFAGPQADAIIMVLYLLSQGLIVWGVLKLSALWSREDA